MLIDRDALIDIINIHRRDLWDRLWNVLHGNMFESRDYLRGLENGYWEIKKDIEQLPTIDPVKHGRWIFEPKDALEAMFTLPKCSECGHESSDALNYCPNCGALMREDGEEV